MLRKNHFHFDLPPELIAQSPPAVRSDARLLVLPPEGRCQDEVIKSLPSILHPGDLLVFNDTRVIPARFFGRKPTGGRVECLIERLLAENEALIHLRVSKVPAVGSILLMEGEYRLRIIARESDLYRVELVGPGSFSEMLDAVGHIPLPPYILRADGPLDQERYQTIFARAPGAVAAPTAGLHFDPALLQDLAAHGIESTTLTLHVGSGTFRPIRVDDLDQHQMHKERYVISAESAAHIMAVRSKGGRIVAVGTTAVRALESAARDGILTACEGETDLFIRPGFRFQVVDALLTNFHLPESTLLALVCAFGGYEEVMTAYRHAVDQRYRFFSYGDAMFLTRSREFQDAP